MLLASLVDLGVNQTKIKDAIFNCQNFLAGSKISKVDFLKTTSHGFAATSLKLEYTDDSNHRKGFEMYRSLTKCCDSLGLDQRAKIFALDSTTSLFCIKKRSRLNSVGERSMISPPLVTSWVSSFKVRSA